MDTIDHASSSALAGSSPAPQRPCRTDGYRLETIEQELLLFDPAESVVLYCNQTAALVWGLCDGSRDFDEIVALLAKAFPEAGPELAADVRQAVDDLVARRALRLAC